MKIAPVLVPGDPKSIALGTARLGAGFCSIARSNAPEEDDAMVQVGIVSYTTAGRDVFTRVLLGSSAPSSIMVLGRLVGWSAFLLQIRSRNLCAGEVLDAALSAFRCKEHVQRPNFCAPSGHCSMHPDAHLAASAQHFHTWGFGLDELQLESKTGLVGCEQLACFTGCHFVADTKPPPLECFAEGTMAKTIQFAN